MAFFLREDAKDDLNAKPRGRAMHYHDTDKSPYKYDEREAAKDTAAKAMQSYENPLHRPVYDRMVAYSPEKHHNQQQPQNPRSNTAMEMRTAISNVFVDDKRFNDYPFPHKKAVVGGDDVIRRGNGNIIAPKPLPWEEAKPRVRGAQQYPDSFLRQCANHNEEIKDQQIKNMNAQCGQDNFYKGFSNKPTKAVGTYKVPQEALNSNGMGIWGFESMGKMSKESTSGLRQQTGAVGAVVNTHNNVFNTNANDNSFKGGSASYQQQQPHPNTHHLKPLESKASLQNRLGNGNPIAHQQPTAASSADASAAYAARTAQLYEGRPWARPSDLQQQKIQNGFAEAPPSPSGYKNQSPNRSPHPNRDKNASVLNDCFQFTHDKTSTDPALRQRSNRYPDPSTVPHTNTYEFHEKMKKEKLAAGGIHKQHSQNQQQGNIISAPPGTKFPSRSETTMGAMYGERAQTSMM